MRKNLNNQRQRGSAQRQETRSLVHATFIPVNPHTWRGWEPRHQQKQWGFQSHRFQLWATAPKWAHRWTSLDRRPEAARTRQSRFTDLTEVNEGQTFEGQQSPGTLADTEFSVILHVSVVLIHHVVDMTPKHKLIGLNHKVIPSTPW